jgi:hypothetical protein
MYLIQNITVNIIHGKNKSLLFWICKWHRKYCMLQCIVPHQSDSPSIQLYLHVVMRTEQADRWTQQSSSLCITLSPKWKFFVACSSEYSILTFTNTHRPPGIWCLSDCYSAFTRLKRWRACAREYFSDGNWVTEHKEGQHWVSQRSPPE